MINRFPLKLMIDSRATSLGNSSAFSVSLPETLHLPENTAMYVNAASVTNTFLSTGTHIGANNTTFTGLRSLTALTRFSIAASFQSRATTQKTWRAPFKHP